MSKGFFSFFSNFFSTNDSHSSDLNSTDTYTADFGQMFDDSPGINPATGLPMISAGGVDVAGNPYGTDLSDNFSSTNSTNYCNDSLTHSGDDNCWDSSSSSSSFDDWSSGSRFDGN